jgi:hypothetical protein
MPVLASAVKPLAAAGTPKCNWQNGPRAPFVFYSQRSSSPLRCRDGISLILSHYYPCFPRPFLYTAQTLLRKPERRETSDRHPLVRDSADAKKVCDARRAKSPMRAPCLLTTDPGILLSSPPLFTITSDRVGLGAVAIAEG